MKDLILRGQFIDSCTKDLSLFLRERQPASLEAAAPLSEQYLAARGGMFSQTGQRQTRDGTSFMKKPDGQTNMPGPNKLLANNQIECFNCHKLGHVARNCPEPRTSPRTCYICHQVGHIAKQCNFNRPRLGAAMIPDSSVPNNVNQSTHHFWVPHNYSFPYSDGQQFVPPPGHPMSGQFNSGQSSLNDQSLSTEVRFGASCVVVGSPPQSLTSCCVTDKNDHVTLQCGHSLPIMSAACSDKLARKMPVTKGYVGDKQVSVLRDSGCSGAVIRKSLVLPQQMTGKESTCVLIDGTVRKVPVARIHVDTPYLVDRIDVLCMQNPLYDLILGNVQGIRPPDKPDPTWTPMMQMNAVQTRAQVEAQGKPLKPLKVPQPLQDVVTPEKLQKEVSSLSHILETTEPDVAATAVIECEDEEDVHETPLSNKSLLQPFPFESQESVADVTINEDLTPAQHAQINQILTEYKDVFTDLPGRTTLASHDIKLKEDEPPRGKPYPIPHALRQTMKDEVQKMISLDVVEPSNSPFASPIVLVKKPDGSNRFCVDFRRLNRVTVFDAEPIPDQEELFSKLSHAKYFTKVDLSKGYWQVPMSETSKQLTAFLTPDGLFQFTVMPFGLVNAPATFSRLMRRALDGLPDTINYIDDILVYSSTWTGHVETLKQLFERLRVANLTAKPSKCQIAQEKVEFLGHVIGQGKLTPRPEKVSAIQEISRPQTKKQLRSFLGTTNYYRKFIPNYSAIAAPLTDKLKNREPNQVGWGESEEQAFHTLKSKLYRFPILRLPDLTKKFVLRTDASDTGLDAVLLQEHGNEKFSVSYASRKLLKREKAYSVIEKECLAIIWAVQKFEPYLYGSEFDLETDYQSLVYMQRTKVANNRVMRWALALQPYRFRLVSIKGSENIGADVLSRL